MEHTTPVAIVDAIRLSSPTLIPCPAKMEILSSGSVRTFVRCPVCQARFRNRSGMIPVTSRPLDGQKRSTLHLICGVYRLSFSTLRCKPALRMSSSGPFCVQRGILRLGELLSC